MEAGRERADERLYWTKWKEFHDLTLEVVLRV